MASFKVGDKVRFKPGVCISHEIFNWKLLYWHPDENLPDYFTFKDVYTILNSVTEVGIDAVPGGSGWAVSPLALEHVNLLTEEKRFAKSKHRVETRHLRKKVCQKVDQKTDHAQTVEPRDMTEPEITYSSSPTVPAGTVLDADTLSQYLERVAQTMEARRPSFPLDYTFSP